MFKKVGLPLLPLAHLVLTTEPHTVVLSPIWYLASSQLIAYEGNSFSSGGVVGGADSSGGGVGAGCSVGGVWVSGTVVSAFGVVCSVGGVSASGAVVGAPQALSKRTPITRIGNNIRFILLCFSPKVIYFGKLEGAEPFLTFPFPSFPCSALAF